MRRSSTPLFIILFLVTVLLGGLAMLATRPYGLGVSTDAVEYLFTGSNLAAGRGFLSYDLRPYALWPPLYPILIGAVHALSGLQPLAAATLLHGLTLLGLATGTARLMLRLFPGRWLWPLLGTTLVGLAPVSLLLAQHVCSDYLFLLFCLLFFLDGERYLAASTSGTASTSGAESSPRQPDGQTVLWLRLFTWGMLGALQRYIGVSLILAAVIVVITGTQGTWRKRLALAGLQLLGGLPLLAWSVRNVTLGMGPFGVRGQTDQSIWDLLAELGRLLASWFAIPAPGAASWLAWVGFSLALMLMFTGAWLVVGRIRMRRIMAARQDLIQGHTWASTLVPILIFAALYAGLLAASLYNVQVTDIQERFLAPLLLPVVVLLLRSLVEIETALQARGTTWRHPRLLPALLALAPLAWLALLALRAWPLLTDFEQVGAVHGNRYNTSAWQSKEIFHFLKDHPLAEGAVLLSNLPAGAAFQTGWIVLPSPRYYTEVHAGQDYVLQSYLDTFDHPGQPVYLIWIEPNEYTHVFHPAHLRTIVRLIKLQAFTDGSILFQVSAR